MSDQIPPEQNPNDPQQPTWQQPTPAQPQPGTTQPQPGWYPDATGTMRWWDGTQWGATADQVNSGQVNGGQRQRSRKGAIIAATIGGFVLLLVIAGAGAAVLFADHSKKDMLNSVQALQRSAANKDCKELTKYTTTAYRKKLFSGYGCTSLLGSKPTHKYSDNYRFAITTISQSHTDNAGKMRVRIKLKKAYQEDGKTSVKLDYTFKHQDGIWKIDSSKPLD